MKIFDAHVIKKADEVTISSQNITSLELMERAANQAYMWLKKEFPDKETLFHVFCGQGNNGGDGLVIARLLHTDGYRVITDVCETAGRPTPDFNANLKRLNEAGIELNNKELYDYTKGKRVIVDAIFGIGLSREPDDEVKGIINSINSSKAIIVAIDVPSGLYLDRKTSVAVQSDVVLTFQFPKLAFYLADNYHYVKRIEILDIGLDDEFINAAESHYHLITKDVAHTIYKPTPFYAHKGNRGHALIIGGSYGKIGAVTLAAKAALKSGCGLVTAYLPECGYTIIQAAFPEAMALTNGEKFINHIQFSIEPKAIGIGMGMGQEQETQQAFYEFLQQERAPIVIDADALNMLSYNKEWLTLLPQNAILTPHPKELERLIGYWEDDFERLEKMKAFSKQYNVILVGKDARTIIVNRNEVFINSTGNAALATGGTGDVLTGIITGLLAQGYNPVNAAILGVYLHGLSADIGVSETGVEGFTATDIFKYLGSAFQNLAKFHP